MENENLLEVYDLKQYFKVRSGGFRKTLRAVDGVSFSIARGEVLGLVGESGSGKTTVGRSILGLYEPTKGEIVYKGQAIKSEADLKAFRKNATMVFQDPYSSLNPRMTVMDIIGEPLDINKLYSTQSERNEKILSFMRRVGLNEEHASRYPHEFSGGQRQRIGIARALATEPELIICDEPVSALDLSIQAQVINMFYDLKSSLGLSYLFIAHDLPVVHHISDRIAVMYLGRIVEIGPADEIMENPINPYTELLVSSIPDPDPRKRSAEASPASSDNASPIDKPSGCPFRTRCPHARELCGDSIPELIEYKAGHSSACHRAKDIYGL